MRTERQGLSTEKVLLGFYKDENTDYRTASMYRPRENHLKKGMPREMLSRKVKQERNIIYV